MDKKAIIAIVLSMAVLFIFQYMQTRREPAVQTAYKTRGTEQAQRIPPSDADNRVDAGSLPAQTQGAPSELPGPEQEEQTILRTSKYDIVFTNIGGSIRRIGLEQYRTRDREEIIYEQEDPSQRLFALKSAQYPDLDRQLYDITREPGKITASFKEPGRFSITKIYRSDREADHFNVEIRISNLSSGNMRFAYTLVGPGGLKRTTRIIGRSFLQANTMINGELWTVKSVKTPESRSGSISWTGIKNRYFTVALNPQTSPRAVEVMPAAEKNLLIQVKTPSYSLAPGASEQQTYILYAGPLDEQKLAAFGKGMEKLVDYGFFGPVSKVLLTILRFFYGIVHNWGLAIICLTILINLLLFPLTSKSFSSMQQMKKVQPHIQKLKELHKDDPQRLNKEMMELYKKYNVNPLGGCLPMLLQMPIFISLYQGLIRSIELKGANFLWINNLAKPDAVPIPFTLPFLGDHINILPLLMVGMMLMQQKISQAGAAASPQQQGQQKMMMLLMPLFFGFIFYNMPAGLVLYWLTNTILMTTEQSLILKRAEAE